VHASPDGLIKRRSQMQGEMDAKAIARREQAAVEGSARGERVPLRKVDLALIFAFWTCMAILTAVSQAMDPRARPPVPRVLPSVPVAFAFVQSYLWALITPFVFWLTNRYTLERSRWLRRLVLFVLVGLAVSIAMDVAMVWLRGHVLSDGLPRLYRPTPGLIPLPGVRPDAALALPPFRFPGPIFAITHFWFLYNLIVYIAVLSAGVARDYSLHYRSRQQEAVRLEAEAAQLKAQLAEARLASLRTQLDPHFLFNTLHAVSSLVERDPRGVRRMISRLSELLRRSLEGADAQEVPLERELEFVSRYLEIMQIRFQGSLTVETRVDPAVNDALVPNLVLQPLVENAIKHGVSKVAQGRVEIGAWRSAEDLVLQVRDNGPGAGGAQRGEGVGLRNTRERLGALYGDAQGLRFSPSPDGTVVEVVLPFHTASDLRAVALSTEE
jgi:signal transduction histidine kinase